LDFSFLSTQPVDNFVDNVGKTVFSLWARANFPAARPARKKIKLFAINDLEENQNWPRNSRGELLETGNM
jgi:hypothetical protein